MIETCNHTDACEDTDKSAWTTKPLGIADIPRLSEVDQQCLQLINEFLVSYECDATSEALVNDCEKLGFAPPNTVERKERIKKENITKILEHLTANNLVDFFEAWKTLVPPSIQDEMEYKKLTFYLHVHFAVLPLRNTCDGMSVTSPTHSDHQSNNQDDDSNSLVFSNKDKHLLSETGGCSPLDSGSTSTNGMYVLKNFLDTKGTEFSTEPEFLPFYALPFISDPTLHPSFKNIFTEGWASSLRVSVEQFVVDHCWGEGVSPRLVALCSTSQTAPPSQRRLHCTEVHRSYHELKRRFHRLNKDHHNLIGITTELTSALESSVQGQAVDLKTTLNNCTRIFPELFKQAQARPETSEETVSLLTGIDHSPVTNLCMSYDLDFRKLKHHLATASIKTRLLLLQALRWRITRIAPEERDILMLTYARHDLLSLHPHSEPTLMSGFFSPAHSATPHPLQQVAARLVNTLASLHCGRDYLCSAGCGLVKVLVACLRGDKGIKKDKITSDMIIATLQKLSLRHSQRITMIELGVVEWLVQSLSAEYTNMRTYTLEYTTALLMNLCLHRQAKERCVPLSKLVLKVLSGLLGTELTHAVPYVNGTLYSLLANPLINQEAKKMGLCKVLDHYLQRSDGEMHKQLEYILRLHRGDCQPDQSSVLSEEENEGDDTEAVDLLEDELDTEDPVRTSHGELHGEQLLYQQYRLLFPYHGVVHPSSSLVPSGEVLVRSTTPRLHSSSTRDTLAPQESSPPPTAATSIDLSEESVTLPTTHDSDNLVVESFESEQEKEEEEEDQSESCKSPVTAQTSVGDTEGGTIAYKLESEIGKIEDSFEQSKEPNSSPFSEDGDDECKKAFRSRPRIPRTPTFTRQTNAWK